MSGVLFDVKKNKDFRLTGDLWQKPWYPFVLSVYPVFFMVAHNIDQISLNNIEIAICSLTSFFFFSFLYAVIVRVTSNQNKAALITLLGIGWVFLYNVFFELFSAYKLYQIARHAIIFPVWTLSFGAGTLCIVRIKILKYQGQVNQFLNIFAFAAILMSIINIGLHTIPKGIRKTHAQYVFNHETVPLANRVKKPDVFLIVMDTYGSSRQLQQQLDYSNGGFVEYLQKKDFVVYKQAHSNYSYTHASIASLLNMEYINGSSNKYSGEKNKDFEWITEYIKNNRVMQIFKSLDYTCIAIGGIGGSWWKFKDKNVNNEKIDKNLFDKWNMTDLRYSILKNSILRVVLRPVYAYYRRKGTAYTTTALHSVHKDPSPKFVYAHYFIPHPPLAFGPWGEFLYKEGTDQAGLKEGYLLQVRYTEYLMEQLIDSVLASYKNQKPIIILCSDHGFANNYMGLVNTNAAFSSADSLHIKIQLGNFIAIYDKKSHLQKDSTDGMTLVNVFRRVFNQLFDAKLPLLSDSCFYANNSTQPFKFVDVTNIVLQR